MAGFEHQHLKEMKAGLCELHIQGSSSSAAPCEETSETMTIMGGGGGPYPDVDKSLRALAGAAEGFGHAAVGGLNGKLYYVTSLEGGISSMHHPPAVYPICSILCVAQMDPSDCSILHMIDFSPFCCFCVVVWFGFLASFEHFVHALF